MPDTPTDPALEDKASQPQAQAPEPQPSPPTPAPAEATTPDNTKPGQLPAVYAAAAQARVAGYSWPEINDKLGQARQAATDAGYSPAEVDKAFGLAPSAARAVDQAAGTTPVNLNADVAAEYRQFAKDYMTPHRAADAPFPAIHSAGDLARAAGWEIVDMAKTFGGGVVNGIAAIAEMGDGKPRSLADKTRLGIEAQGFLMTLNNSGGIEDAGAKPGGVEALKQKFPQVQDTLDAATAVANHTPEGLTPETLTSAAKTLGDNFVKTGEHPIEAASRAVADPEVMAQMHEQMAANQPTVRLYHGGGEYNGGSRWLTDSENYAQGYANKSPGGFVHYVDLPYDHPLLEENRDYSAVEGTGMKPPLMHFDAPPEIASQLQRLNREPPALPPRDEMMTPEEHAAASAEAVKQPGFITDRPALEPVASNEALDPLTAMGTPGNITEANLGGNPFSGAHMPQMDINPETIGIKDTPLGEGLMTSFKRVFSIQSLDRDGAGVIRSHLADTQASRIRDAENLRRFGRAINDTSSVDRRTWWDSYEGGNTDPYKGTALGDMGDQIRGALDRKYQRMADLGIDPGYIENYLPRLYQNTKAASAYFSKRPLEGTKTFTRERVYQTLREAEASGLKLATDNPVEATLIRLSDMDHYITAHEIMKELSERNLGHRFAPGSAIPDGFTRVASRIADTSEGSFYTTSPVATMMDRYLSRGFNGEPVYDLLRSSVSTITSMKLMTSLFHPLYLAWDAQAGAFGLGLKQIGRGGAMNIAEGAGKVLKFPIAPIENYLEGRRVNDFAKTGNGPPRIATMYDAMIQSGARFQQAEAYKSSAAGSFWSSIGASARNMVYKPNGHTLFSQEIAGMIRNTPDLMIGNTKVAPGYLAAVAKVVPRVMDSLTAPIMGHLVPMLKTGALSRMLQEEMTAHPGMGIDDIRRVGGRMSDQIDNRIGEVVQDNLFWPAALHNINNVAFMAPQWFMGKLRLFTGAADELRHFGTQSAPGMSRELGDNLTYLIGGVAATVFTGGLFGYLKGTWKPDWTLRDYMAPPTGGKDKQGGDERIMLPALWRDAYGWSTDPKHELTNKAAPMWSLLGELATNSQFNGAAITDPASSWKQAGGDYGRFTAQQLAPMMWSNVPGPDTNIDFMTRLLGGREAPFGVREPELEEKYDAKDARTKLRKKARIDAQAESE